MSKGNEMKSFLKEHFEFDKVITQLNRYRTRATISRSRFEAALVYKPRILSLKYEEFPFLVHKLSAKAAAKVKIG